MGLVTVGEVGRFGQSVVRRSAAVFRWVVGTRVLIVRVDWSGLLVAVGYIDDTLTLRV